MTYSFHLELVRSWEAVSEDWAWVARALSRRMSSQSEGATGTEVLFHSGDLIDIIFVTYNVGGSNWSQTWALVQLQHFLGMTTTWGKLLSL